jgi:DNA-binding transcriptional LysR family regulator
MASTQAFVDAALAGLGWGMNPEPLVADHLAADLEKILLKHFLNYDCKRYFSR